MLSVYDLQSRDFKEYSLEGVEEDWPLSYQELAPDYSHVEKMIGVTGSRENLEIVPDGVVLPAAQIPLQRSRLFSAPARKLGIRHDPGPQGSSY